MDEGRVIGLNNQLPWNIPEDLKHFSELTSGHTVLMGRNTWESLPGKYRPLPNRLNIVCTRTPEALTVPETVLKYASPEEVIRAFLAGSITAPSSILWVVGGEQVYRATRNYWTELFLTVVHSTYKGDTFFPEFEQDFSLVDSDDRKGFSFRRYTRNGL